jgi:hypothetical protein
MRNERGERCGEAMAAPSRADHENAIGCVIFVCSDRDDPRQHSRGTASLY